MQHFRPPSIRTLRPRGGRRSLLPGVLPPLLSYGIWINTCHLHRVRTTTTTTTTTKTQAVGVLMDAERVIGAAKRRRERRLRLWLRHGRMNVAAGLFAAPHHSHDGEARSPTGTGVTTLEDAAGQSRWERPQPAALLRETPLLGVSLADASAGAIDGRTLRFVLKENLALNTNNTQQQHTTTTTQKEHNLRRLRFNRRGASSPLWGVESLLFQAGGHPALRRQDTTSPWSTDYGGNIFC